MHEIGKHMLPFDLSNGAGERCGRDMSARELMAGVVLPEIVELEPRVLRLDTPIDAPRLSLSGRSRNLLQTYGILQIRDLFVIGLFHSQALARIGQRKRLEITQAFEDLHLPADEIPQPAYAARFCAGLHELNPYAVLQNVRRRQPSEAEVIFRLNSEQNAPKITWKRLLSRDLQKDAVWYDGTPDAPRFMDEYGSMLDDFVRKFLETRAKIDRRER